MQAVFWDFDNTIIDTASAHWKKHHTILSRQGIQLNPSYQKRIYENNGSQNWKWLHEELGLKMAEKEYLEAIDFEFQQNMHNLEMRPGVLELLQTIKQLNIPQAIVTNARRNSAKPLIDQKNISPFMQFILFKEDYEGRKPDPAPYFRAFEKMETFLNKPLEPKRCLVIEDDPKGVESAHKAGATVIHRKLHEEGSNSPYADYCCFHTEAFLTFTNKLFT